MNKEPSFERNKINPSNPSNPYLSLTVIHLDNHRQATLALTLLVGLAYG